MDQSSLVNATASTSTVQSRWTARGQSRGPPTLSASGFAHVHVRRDRCDPEHNVKAMKAQKTAGPSDPTSFATALKEEAELTAKLAALADAKTELDAKLAATRVQNGQIIAAESQPRVQPPRQKKHAIERDLEESPRGKNRTGRQGRIKPQTTQRCRSSHCTTTTRGGQTRSRRCTPVPRPPLILCGKFARAESGRMRRRHGKTIVCRIVHAVHMVVQAVLNIAGATEAAKKQLWMGHEQVRVVMRH